MQDKQGKGNKYGKEMKQLHLSTVHALLRIFEVQLAVFVLQQNFITLNKQGVKMLQIN